MPKLGDKFPHFTIEIEDKSRRALPPPPPRGLHQPIFFLFAERGPINVPTYGTIAELTEIFGSLTFNLRSKYVQHPTLFARAAAGFAGVWVVRLADADAARASLVLEAQVIEKDLVQYQKGPDGSRLLDESGDPIPELEVDEVTEVEEAGVELTWAVRAIDYAGDETLTNLTSSSEVVGSDTVVTYPILAIQATDVGSAGNFVGFKFYYTSEYDEDAVENIGAMTFRLAPVRLNETTDIASSIFDKYNAPYIDVSLKRDALDPSTNLHYDLEDRVVNQYIVTDGNTPFSPLGCDLHVYDGYVKTIADLIVTKEDTLTAADAWKINLLSGIDTAGVEYDHFAVTNPAAFTNSQKIMYLQDGSDGDITVSSLHDLTATWLEGDVFPEITDEARYPITHVYDSGYPLATKTSMIAFLGVRRDVKIDLSTQDVLLDANTKAEDQSTLTALRSQVLLYPESAYYGTEAIRASIYLQCGRLISDRSYTKLIPLTYERMIKRCAYDASPKIIGEPTGLPRSQVEYLDQLNWTTASDTQKRENWAAAGNAVQHFDTTGLHFPDYRSAYPHDDSVLSSDISVDRLIYIKGIVRRTWAAFAGRREPSVTLYDAIERKMLGDLYNAFGSKVPAELSLFKSEEDEARGYVTSARLSIKFPHANRVLNVTIPVDRVE